MCRRQSTAEPPNASTWTSTYPAGAGSPPRTTTAYARALPAASGRNIRDGTTVARITTDPGTIVPSGPATPPSSNPSTVAPAMVTRAPASDAANQPREPAASRPASAQSSAPASTIAPAAASIAGRFRSSQVTLA